MTREEAETIGKAIHSQLELLKMSESHSIIITGGDHISDDECDIQIVQKVTLDGVKTLKQFMDATGIVDEPTLVEYLKTAYMLDSDK